MMIFNNIIPFFYYAEKQYVLKSIDVNNEQIQDTLSLVARALFEVSLSVLWYFPVPGKYGPVLDGAPVTDIASQHLPGPQHHPAPPTTSQHQPKPPSTSHNTPTPANTTKLHSTPCALLTTPL